MTSFDPNAPRAQGASGLPAGPPGSGSWTPPPWEKNPRKPADAPLPKRGIPLNPGNATPANSPPPRPAPEPAPELAPAPAPEEAGPQGNEEPQAPDTSAPAPEPQGEVAQPAPRKYTPGQVDKALTENLGITTMSPRHKVEAWLAVMVKAGASDLILRAGGRPSTRIDGRIGFLPGRVPGAGPMLEVLEWVMGKERMELFNESGSVDAALQLDGLGRFRLNAYKQMGDPALVLRRVSEDAPLLDSLNLPASELTRIALRKRGLVLVTGIAGSGKSTTLAGMIQYMNVNAERHIVTLEDPIEVLFKEQRCVISQREVGIDVPSFHEGLRHALRQSPDVILIGEMRDRETVAAALDAAETGHLVLSTMHTVNAAQTLDRILGFFKSEQHSQIRTRLADNMAAVLSQRLLPRAEGKGMVPSFELMTQTPRIRELLEEGETGEIMRTIEQGGAPGLISFNQSLRRLVQQKLVELKDALAASDRPDELVLALRGITSSSGRSLGQNKNEPGSRPPPPAPPKPGSGGGLRMGGE